MQLRWRSQRHGHRGGGVSRRPAGHLADRADAIGSRSLTWSSQRAAMREAGARTCASLPAPFGLGFLAGHRTDLRNHRKIIVVDGHIIWGGSQNCADPACLPKRRCAPRIDSLIRYDGPVARQADPIFASASAICTCPGSRSGELSRYGLRPEENHSTARDLLPLSYRLPVPPW